MRLLSLIVSLACVSTVSAQTLDVVFRYVPGPSDEFVRAFLPGDFNGWGPFTGGTSCIQVDAAHRMTYVDSLDQFVYTQSLDIDLTTEYKVHFHRNEDGTECTWISDPLNPITNPADNNNSVLEVTDPMVFQPAAELNEEGLIDAVSAGLFGTDGFETIEFQVNGVPRDGMAHFDRASGIFRYVLDNPIQAGSQFRIVAADSLGREVSAEIGEILPPVTWVTPDHETFVDLATVRAQITRQDGTVDPTITEATLIENDVEASVEVDNGAVEVARELDRGANEFVLRADVDGATFTSDTLVVTRLQHPLADSLVTATVSGSDFDFMIRLDAASGYIPPELGAPGWVFDSTASTVDLELIGYAVDGFSANGTAEGPGEVYFDVSVTADDGSTDFLSVGIIIEEDGSVRPLQYEETASWINRAVVYEIFPLSFGPTEASGTPAAPGMRLDEIAAELDYIAQMGFTTLWFMPIFHNQFMDPLSGGYNIIDFYTVDPKLGTNADFKALVDRAHELGLRVILDVTPNHVSPVHPWVNSVRELGEDSPYFGHLQTEPSQHSRGEDGRGPNLPEVWHTEGGTNLYRKYDGFGDLANLNWDDDDLQAHLLDVFAYWVREFDVDGYRMDVYWGPWRRYGPERFGRPIRDVVRRIKPDAWLLGEIAGTGPSTEVYYADDDFGTSIVGGVDAGYDWNFYFNGIRDTYGNISNYDNWAHNNDFYPGPNARYFRFLENHDETRIAKVHASNPERVLPLTAMLLTTTGIPMVYQGQEVNFGNIGGDERRRPVSWETERNYAFAQVYQQLAHARTSFPAFWTQELTTLSTSSNVYAYVRPYLDENAVVLINIAADPRTVTINPTAHVEMSTADPIPYTHLFADSSFTDTEQDGFGATLAGYETAVFITSANVDFSVPELPSLPFDAVYTGSEESFRELPDETALHANYPNPFNPSTTISYSLAAAAHVRLEVFDVLGRRVATLVDGPRSAGTHEAVFNANGLSSGNYYYRLDVNGRVFSKPMLLVK